MKIVIALTPMFLLLSYVVWFYDGSETRKEVAEDYAQQLGLQNPKVVCEDVLLSCGCLVVHGPVNDRKTNSWGCCAGGCE